MACFWECSETPLFRFFRQKLGFALLDLVVFGFSMLGLHCLLMAVTQGVV
jgi:hypothetical protein